MTPLRTFVLVLIMCRVFAFAQSSVDLSRIADEMVSTQDEDLNYDDLYENLSQYLSDPLDINTASADDLRQTYILQENQIQALLTYRDSVGSLISLYELQSVPLFDDATIQRLIPFVSIKRPEEQIDRSLLKNIASLPNAYLLLRYERTLEAKKGSRGGDNPFLGSPEKMYLRFRSSKSGDHSVGFTAEKDAGEVLKFSPGYYGVDFLSWHVQLKNKGRLTNLIAGDFQAQFGQGLIMGGAFGLGKGGETITTIRRTNIGFTPYTSANESGFYRGVAFTTRLTKSISLSSFFSSTRRSANLTSSDTSVTVTSILTTGLHRTASELEDRRQLKEQGLGAVLQFTTGMFDGGIIFQQITYDIPIARRESLFNQFAFQGTFNNNIGAFVNYSIGNYTFFSEYAHSISKGNAFVGGMLTSVSSRFDVATLFRNYRRDYQPFYSNALSESTDPKNESGIYMGWKYKWSKKIQISGYVDYFVFPWLGFRRYAPSDGYEWLLRLSYQPTRKIVTFLQFREESKARNVEVDKQYGMQQSTKQNFWLSTSVPVTDRLKLKTRVQYSKISNGPSAGQGLAVSQDIQFEVRKFQFTTRYAIFDTDNFDNRQYSYENDVFMAFSLPAYDGTGMRNYLMVEYKINKHLSLWCRFARSLFTDREVIGSGADEITGNKKNDVKFQLLIRL